jgi:HrpA-like RNA helicase
MEPTSFVFSCLPHHITSLDIITHMHSTGDLTRMGNFVAGLGVDLQLGRMIGLGAQFGCLAEVSLVYF